MIYALAGNPNSGKSTLFNELTGGNQHVGNRSGVTVDIKTGLLRKKYISNQENNSKVQVTDLPGIYSLKPSSEEQRITKEYIETQSPDLIINVVDATNLEHNLYFTLQLMRFNIPILVALNMIDVIESKKNIINCKKLEERLGLKCVKISSRKKTGISELIEMASEVSREKSLIIKPEIESMLMGCRGCSHNCETSAISRCYNFVYSAIRYAMPPIKYENKFTEFLDKIALGKYLGIPFFLLVMFIIFSLSFGKFSKLLETYLQSFFSDYIVSGIVKILTYIGSTKFVIEVFTDGICRGTEVIVAFLPHVTIMFILLAFFEDCGYMIRVSFLLDTLMRKIGISGKSFMPLVIGFGCNVPAIIACRTLDNPKERKLTSMIIPFVSCSARIPVYTFMVNSFFHSNESTIILLIYFLGIIIAIFYAYFINKLLFKSQESEFLIEIPPYRWPSLKYSMMQVWAQLKDFIIKVGTLVTLFSVIIYVMSNYSMTGIKVDDMSQSIIGSLGGFLAFIFRPLGFGTWQSVVALITGIFAKETIVSTLNILSSDITQLFVPATAISFIIFSSLYLSCISTIVVLKNELKDNKLFIFSIISQLIVAWIVTYVIYVLINLGLKLVSM